MKKDKDKRKSIEIEEIDLDDLMDIMGQNVTDDITSFEDLVNLQGSVNRELYVGDIVPGLGSTIDGFIRFWNTYDEKKKIEVKDRKPILLYIDSNGGSLTDTFTMIDAIKMSKTPVWTIVTGCAYSGGFFTAIAGHKRLAYPHASFMMHEGATQTGGDAHKFVNYTEFYKKQLSQLKNHVIDNTKIDDDLYEKNKRDDWWFTAEEALELEIIDEICEGLI